MRVRIWMMQYFDRTATEKCRADISTSNANESHTTTTRPPHENINLIKHVAFS